MYVGNKLTTSMPLNQNMHTKKKEGGIKNLKCDELSMEVMSYVLNI